MSIRAEIKTLSIVVFAAVLIAFATLAFYFVQTQRETNEMRNAGEFIAGVTQLRFAAVETMLYGGIRPAEQWNRSHSSLVRLINSQKFSSQQEALISRKMRTQLSAVNVLYKKLSDNVSKKTPENQELRQDAIARTSTEILLITQDLLGSASTLYKINLDQLSSAQQMGGVILITLIIALSTVVLWVFELVKRRVLIPLAIFETGTNVIAAGNFTHRFDMPYQNEIGQLGRTFDSMTQRLDHSYTKLSEENALRRNVQNQMEKTHEDLRRARDDAEAANRAKGMFLANMSHEIRTPMNAVLGMLQLVKKTALSSLQYDYLSKADAAAKLLLGLLNNILDFSKIDEGKLQLELQPFSIEELMEGLSVVLSGTQHEEDVEIIFDIDPTLPKSLRGDRLRLSQILINLTSNAMKFTKNGHIVVHLSAKERTTEVITLRTEVRDTGIGISSEQTERIFDGFTQAEASTARRFGGTGLGLAISQRLVALMGGTLLVDSKLGHGSRFWFDLTLPIEDTERSVDATMTLPKNLHVLVVDDNAVSNEILVKTIEGLGWAVESAQSGVEGVEHFCRAFEQEIYFDAVFMDWRMPGMNGLDAASQIKKVAHGVKTPVIVMVTAFGRAIFTEAAQKHDIPFSGFLTKPATAQQLAMAVQTALAAPNLEESGVLHSDVNQLRLQNLHVLLVEDNAVNRQVATELLRAEGAQVAVATGGRQGIKMATEHNCEYDLIIMDMQMPDLDGLEATRSIRADENCRQVPILAMTANVSHKDRDECLAAGMDDHIGKPIEIDKVVAKILALLKKEVPVAALVPIGSEAPDSLVESHHRILTRFGQNSHVYRMALSEFKAEGLRLVDALEQQVQRSKLVDAGETMHALNGMAATVGALALKDMAANLEACLKAKNSTTLDCAISTETIIALRDLIDRSNTALNERVVGTLPENLTMQLPGRDGIHVAQQISLLHELEMLLNAGNLRAITLAEAFAASTVGEVNTKAIELLDSAKSLQFSVATEIVQSLLRALR